MAKTKISEFSSTPANNTDIDSINIAEGCAPSNINDAIRELMAQLKDFQTGAQGDSFNGPIGSSTAVSGAFTNITASGTLGVTGVATLGAGAILNTPASVTLTNATGLPIATGVSGLGTGVATALAVNVGSAGAPVVNGGALGTPSSGTVTNLTGTASININGTVGATTASTGAFTTLAASGSVTLSGGTANGVTYLNGSKVLTSGSALTFDGTSILSNLNTSTAPRYRIGYNSSTYADWYRDASTGNYTFESQEQGSAFIWSLRPSGGSATEVFRATSTSLYTASGINVGIGTSSPATKLNVSGSSNTLLLNGSGTSTNYARFTSTGGDSVIGLESSTASTICTGSLAYSTLLYTVGSTALQLGTNSTVRATIDTSGNLGLGVTPSAWRSLDKAIQVGNAYFGGLTNTTMRGYFGVNQYINSSNQSTYVYNGYATEYQQNNGTHAWYTAASGTAGDAISFTQAMSLTANGEFLVGKTAQDTTSVGFSVASGGATRTVLTGTSTLDATQFYRAGGTNVGTITCTSTATSYNTSSDYRLKNIIGEITPEESGSYIDSLKPKKGTWKSDGSVFIGLLAHEAQESSQTEIATGVKDGEKMQAMTYASPEMIANLIAEVKSLRQRVATLEAQ